MMSFGPALVMIAIGAGSAIEVGLIGGYGEEDMREWRASLGAYLLIIGMLWAVFCAVDIRPAPDVVGRDRAALAAGAGGWRLVLRCVAGRSERTDGVKTSKGPLEYLAVIAPPVFLIGLVVAVSVLAAALQGVGLPAAETARPARSSTDSHMPARNAPGRSCWRRRTWPWSVASM